MAHRRRASASTPNDTITIEGAVDAACPSTFRKRPPRPSESLTPRQIVAELDKYVVGQHAGQARRGDRAAQPQAAPEAAAGAGRGDRAEEHPDDRPDRRRQDRDRAPARAARAVAVPQGRGVEVHRGRLRRPRRRVDGARPGRDRRRDGAARSGSRRCARRRARRPRSACSICCCRRCRRRPTTTSRPRRSASRRSARARSCASSCATAGSTQAGRDRRPREDASRRSRSSPGSSVEEVDINVKDMLPGLFQGRDARSAGCRCPRRSRRWRRKRSRS